MLSLNLNHLFKDQFQIQPRSEVLSIRTQKVNFGGDIIEPYNTGKQNSINTKKFPACVSFFESFAKLVLLILL